jgi:hypothetical protein
MKTLVMIILLILPTMTFAQCEKAAAGYGDGEGNDSIPVECLKTAEKLAGASAKKRYQNGKVNVVGLKNIVFVNTKVIAGEYTMLQDVIAVAFDEVHNEVAALERNGDVLIFSAKYTGNVAPLRVIRHRELDGAGDITFLPKTEEIAIQLKARKEVLTFSRLANFFGREGHKKLNVRRQILNTVRLPE